MVDTFMGFIGTVTFTSRTMKWVASLGYIGVSAASVTAAYILPKTNDFGSMVLGCD